MIGAVTAYGQIDARSQYGGAAAAVVDGKGNLRTPADYRTTYETLVFKTTTQAMTTGTVSSAGWFVMVKDHVGRFAGNKLWSDGWGWSWFDATTPQKTTSTDYTTDCQGCHVPARQSDWIYTHGYPVLTTNDL